MDNGADEDRRKDGLMWSSSAWKSYESWRRMQKIVMIGKEEPLW